MVWIAISLLLVGLAYANPVALLSLLAAVVAIAFIRHAAPVLRERRKSRLPTRTAGDRRRWTVFGLLLVALMALALTSQHASLPPLPHVRPSEPVSMTVNANYERDRGSWNVLERISIGRALAVKATASTRREPGARGVQRTHRPALGDGWAFERLDGDRLVYARRRFQAVHLPRWQPTKKNMIEAPLADLGEVLLRPDHESTLSFVAPTRLIRKTYPEIEQRRPTLDADKDAAEEVVVNLGESSRGGYVVRFEATGRWFRNDIGWWMLGVTVWGGLKYLLVTLALAFNRRIDEAVVQPLMARLLPERWKPIQPERVAQTGMRFAAGSTSTRSSAAPSKTRRRDR